MGDENVANLDVSTLVLVANLALLGVAVSFAAVGWRDIRQGGPIALWAAGFAQKGLALWLILHRSSLPLFLSLAVGNTLVVTGSQFLLAGTAIQAGTRLRARRHLAHGFSCFVALIFFSVVDFNYPAIAAVVTAYVVAVHIAIAALLLGPSRPRGGVQIFTATVFLASGAIFLVRFAALVLGRIGPEHLFSPSAFTSLAFLEEILGPICMGIGLLAVAYDKARSDQVRLIENLGAAVSSEAEARRAASAAREEALAASRAKSTFMAGISHEILSPLNAILGFAELLKRRQGSSPADREALEAIAAGGRALRGLLTDVLDLAAGEAAGSRLHLSSCEVAVVAEEAMRLVAPRAVGQGILLELEPGDRPPALMVDGARLRQVLLNLLGNAVRHTREGKVALRIATTAGAAPGTLDLRLEVSDTGEGIPLEDQARIFEPFERGSGAVPGGGAGLGLALSRRLVVGMGGRIRLTSAPGQGSTFTVNLPGLEIARALPGTQAGRKSSLTAATVLVVDDEAFNRDLIRAFLREEPVRIEEANGGDSAIASLSQSRPDAVLLDLGMPGTDGMAVYRWARTRPELAGLPIVAITAKQPAASDEAAFDAWLDKPLSRAAVLACLASVLPPRPAVGSMLQGGGPLPPDPEAVVPLRAAAAKLSAAPQVGQARSLAAEAAALAVTLGAPGLARWAERLRAAADAMDAVGVRTAAEALELELQGLSKEPP